ncbi:ABC transporter ATP-binding protein [Aquibium sp. A9E412]|uniref:ABC transporter ATP-binding protein n=1 Tax=Aquibium sp. A9E412 TaxID=2976767 RepID=UPI0025AF4F63|nr:ABC transporter ATP-binding protein [Aquibium sp. A9E412]MDN2566666.1 ABC transporter ATP-binding protein [Aquibium sp. A9E412]
MRVELSDITVRFGDLTAVDRVSLDFRSGEVHALVGENGAGKTTVMNALFGLVRSASGSIAVDGETCRWASPQDAIARGLGMVHQHFMLQDSMTVLENIVLCNEPTGRFGFVDFRAARAHMAEVATAYGIEVDLDATVGALSLGQRQVVEILKVLYRHADMLILDEPTAVLTPQEKDRLFGVLRNFRRDGKAIVLITHKLDEVMELADRVSVMRGGRLISSAPVAETTKTAIARDIVGGELPAEIARAERAPGAVVLSVDGLTVRSRGRTVGPISFDVRAGEIVGVAGVSGNGQAELVQALTGLRRAHGGSVRLAGRPLDGLDVGARRARGMSYIPEDRQRVGLALEARVSENAAIGRMDQPGFRRGPFRIRSAMNRFAAELIARYRIKVAGPEARAATMSGGNKQKLVVGRELSRDTPLVVVENPTWGVDIGAIEFIHSELVRMRDAGHAILMVSTELDEVLALSDRILVLYEGRISGEVARAEADRTAVGQLMVSHGPSAAEIAA